MPLLPITAFYGALLGFLMLYLAFDVVKSRQRHKSGLGHQHNDILVAGRIHANAAEYIPIVLILIALAELNGAPSGLLHIFGAAFLFARVIHAWGFKVSQGATHIGRYWGTVITFLSLILLGLFNLYLCWPYLF